VKGAHRVSKGRAEKAPRIHVSVALECDESRRLRQVVEIYKLLERARTSQRESDDDLAA
jgi:hypothetical protein